MTDERKHPAADDGGVPEGRAGLAQDHLQSIGGSGVVAWKRRHAAASRLPRLDCGCCDPWSCRCTQPPLSEQRIDAGRDAAIYIMNNGMVPVLQIEVLQALWRRGGVERELAAVLFEATGGQIT